MNSGWTAPFLDVFFLVLAVVLFLDPKFEESAQQVEFELPEVSSSEGSLVLTGSELELELEADGTVRHAARSLTLDEVSSVASKSFNLGAQEVVLAVDREAPIGRYVELVHRLQGIGFRSIRLPVKEER